MTCDVGLSEQETIVLPHSKFLELVSGSARSRGERGAEGGGVEEDISEELLGYRDSR